MLLEVVGQFGTGLPPPTRYELSTPLLKEEYVDACIQQVGAEHVVQVVMDNASNNMGAAALLNVTRPKIFWTSCATHTINLMLEVLRMVDADWKPSMGFVYGEMIKAKEGYFYKDTEIQHDNDVSDAVLEFFEAILAGDLEMQLQVTNVEMPKYKKQMDRFGKELAISTCEVNNERHDPANWWGTFGGATPNLKKIAMRILSLTSSSSGCERNWSTFEGIHTKKRNRLEASKLNNLVYVQFNSNLTVKAKRRKARDVEVLLSNDSNMAQEWIVECDGDGNRDGDKEVEVQDQQDQEAQWEVIGEFMEVDEYLQPRQSSRTTTKTTPRELFDEEFESGNEEIVYEEGEYESDGVKIIEDCGDEE
ncbi:ribonuclease H-like domain-containing protein [Tanacetum coccineum]